MLGNLRTTLVSLESGFLEQLTVLFGQFEKGVMVGLDPCHLRAGLDIGSIRERVKRICGNQGKVIIIEDLLLRIERQIIELFLWFCTFLKSYLRF